MFFKRIRIVLPVCTLLLLLALAAPALADDGLTHADVAATDREHTYTTPEDVAAGRRAAAAYNRGEEAFATYVERHWRGAGESSRAAAVAAQDYAYYTQRYWQAAATW